MQSAAATDFYRPPGAEEVHVWTCDVRAATGDLSRWERVLSSGERERASRYRREEDRVRHVVAHGLLRRLLGGYLRRAPADLRFAAGRHGKPALAPEFGLTFNLAHSGALVLCAVAGGRAVGVDVEHIRPGFDVMELAAAQFSDPEVRELRAAPEAARRGLFFRLWTRKEAYLKARGDGLNFPLADFVVGLSGDGAPAVLWAADDPRARERWTLHDLEPAADHAGAVVVEGRPVALVSRHWEE